MKRPTKVSTISIYDFPRNNYRVYWEYAAVDNGISWDWWCRFYEYATGAMIKEESKVGFDTEDAARADAQAWIAANIGTYRREVPLEEVTDEVAAKLAVKFDECRRVATNPDSKPQDRAKAFSGIDQIRGMLRANGFQLAEQPSISYPGETSVHRMGV